MGTGISMSSVNKIKELAENGDYSLALDILEHQDLTKSLSPQFVRICGEVYYENKKYAEARAALVKAHSMAPMGNKIIYSIIKLYLSMGLYELAEQYFDIYRFNQEVRDAGTYRIEYMIAKAYRKPFVELYSILLSANELETDEEWDYEMLLIYAAMNNEDKFKSESEIFKATYKGSARLALIEEIAGNRNKAKDYIYVYPEDSNEDTDANMEETRQIEKSILEEDNLRMNPKDPKIMIMVEDDEPVPNSVKIKTMLVRSKENKKEKKEKHTESKEEKKGWFGKGRISRKDEEAYEEAIGEIGDSEADRQKLLNEVLKADDAEEKEDKVSEEMSELTDETKPEDKVVYNVNDMAEKSFDASIDDFDVEDDVETVVMVDIDSLSDDEISKKTDAAPVTADLKSDENSEEDKYKQEMNSEIIESATDDSVDSSEIENSKQEAQDEFVEPDIPSEEMPEVNEPEQFDFDTAFESLGGFEINYEDNDDFAYEDEFTSDSEDEISDNDDFAYEDEFASDSEDEISDNDSFDEPDIEWAEQSDTDYAEYEQKEVEDNTEYGRNVENVDDEVTEFNQNIEFSVDAESNTSNESEPDIIEQDMGNIPEPELTNDEKPEILKRNIDFPVFRTSLFPDYNRDNPPDIVSVPNKTEDIDIEEEKFQESLKKEEDLISAADKLLAELGIDFGDSYHSENNSSSKASGYNDTDDSEQNITEELKTDVKSKNPFKLRF